MNLTTQDKWLIGGGLALAVTGVVVMVAKSKEVNQDTSTSDTTYTDQPTDTKVTSGTRTQQSQQNNAVAPVQQQTAYVAPDTFWYPIGQEVMANITSGTQTYEVIRKADGNFYSKLVKKAKFNFGDKIGNIIWVSKQLEDGTRRYVIKRVGNFGVIDFYWVAHSGVTPVGKLIQPATKPATTNVSSLNPNLLLSKGSKGAEVKELQIRLGFVTKEKAMVIRTKTAVLIADGDFGPKTETALFNKKGVKSIRLIDFK